MLSPQYISDHLEISQLLTNYVTALDKRNFDAFDNIFTQNAHIDYRAMGGIAGSYSEIKAWLPHALKPFSAFQHFISAPDISITGDTATARTMCHNPMTISLPFKTTLFLGFWYVDELIKTEHGWRIHKRTEEKCYEHNVPLLMKISQWVIKRKKR